MKRKIPVKTTEAINMLVGKKIKYINYETTWESRWQGYCDDIQELTFEFEDGTKLNITPNAANTVSLNPDAIASDCLNISISKKGK